MNVPAQDSEQFSILDRSSLWEHLILYLNQNPYFESIGMIRKTRSRYLEVAQVDYQVEMSFYLAVMWIQ
jgi:hypothetical protein